ncbi:MAG: hypothetical protein GW809_01645 [Bacteroidetes bacterium]|nr:hypothetical protein [Bacteroidota bacterium]NCQ10855.1 hypothetical protein [Bacteroidota bacterium]
MKKIIVLLLLIVSIGSLFSSILAQDAKKDIKLEEGEELQELSIRSRGLQRVGNTFESIWLIDNQTVIVPFKGTLEMDIQHRFGTINNGYDDLWGFYAPSNIRIGFGYVPINNLMLGFGLTKERMLWDFNAKYALLNEKKGSPISLSYFVNVAVDTRKSITFANKADRYSYFHQLMVAKKLTRDFSLQTSVNLSHFNVVEAIEESDGSKSGLMKNDHISLSLLGRYKISDATAFIANYDQPITKHPKNNPNPNLSIGFEIATPLHSFQVFVGNYKWMVPQYSNVFNSNDYKESQFLIGFNITRLIDTKFESLSEMLFKRKKKK